MPTSMQQPAETNNTDHTPRLIELLPDAGSDDFGSAMLRLAYMAAAQHRANTAPKRVKPWEAMTTLKLSNKDKAGQGCPAVSRIARDHGPVTTEGDR